MDDVFLDCVIVTTPSASLRLLLIPSNLPLHQKTKK